MIATAAKNPLIAITPDEGKTLAIAVIDVGKQYAVNINPKVLAWVNLIGAGVAVYGPKVFVMLMQQSARPQQPKQSTAPVELNPGGSVLKFE